MNVLCFGEILWDIINGEAHIGGAPFNLAAHLARMNADSYIISAVGDDKLGREALKKASALNLRTPFVKLSPEHPTGTVDVELAGNGLPSYVIHENTAWDNIIIDKTELEKLRNIAWDVFCFGTLAQRSVTNREALFNLLSELNAKNVFYDVNLRHGCERKELIEPSLSVCSIVKLNDEELVVLSRMLFSSEFSGRDFAEKLSEAYDLDIVIITRGADGAAAFSRGEFIEIPGVSVKVADTVGAGDSFSAGFLLARLNGASLAESLDLAGAVGAFVASQNGAVPIYSEDLARRLEKIQNAP